MQEKSSLKINDLPRSCSKKWFRFWRKFSNDISKMRKLFRLVWNIIFWSTFAFQVVTNFFDKSIKTMLDHATVFVTPISELLVQITPNSSPIVDLIQQIISVFSDVKQVRNQESMSQLWRSYSAWMPQTPSMYILSLTASHQSRRSSSQSWYSFICTRYEILLWKHTELIRSDLYSTLIRKNTQFILTALPPIEGMSMIEHAGKLCHSGLYFCEPPVVKAAISLMTEASRQASLQEMITHFGQAWLLALMDVS